MRETKVLVDELPKSCWDCPCFDSYELQCQINYADCENLDIAIERHKDCPLHSIKDHDRELVEKVIKEVEDSFTKYLPLKNRTGAWFYGRLNEILKKYQKEYEK